MRIPLETTTSYLTSLNPTSPSSASLTFFENETFLIELQGLLTLPHSVDTGSGEGGQAGMSGVGVGKLDWSQPVCLLSLAIPRAEFTELIQVYFCRVNQCCRLLIIV